MKEIQKKLKSMIVLLSFLFTGIILVVGISVINNDRSIKDNNTVTVSDYIITKEKENPYADESNNTIFLSIENDLNSQVSSTEILIPTQGEEQKETNIYLHNKNANDNVSFQVHNMLPGDKETKYFNIELSYKDTVTVHFKPDTHPIGSKLAEVLRCKIVLIPTGETIYDGLMKDISESVSYTLTSQGSTTDELNYQITAYLDTSVDNEYMNQKLEADFHWWVEEIDNLDQRPETGYHLYIYMLGGLGFIVLAVVTFNKTRKEERNEAK
ncbi:MAG: hypothetical protein J6D33_01555 [Turicibacter sp.]|nr:hypothetical protein [Turicibacter sp.]